MLAEHSIDNAFSKLTFIEEQGFVNTKIIRYTQKTQKRTHGPDHNPQQ